MLTPIEYVKTLIQGLEMSTNYPIQLSELQLLLKMLEKEKQNAN